MTTLHNTLEQGKKLKELGVYGQANVWYPYKIDFEVCRFIGTAIFSIQYGGYYSFPEHDKVFPALTLGELFEVIDWKKADIRLPHCGQWGMRVYGGDEKPAQWSECPTHLAADVLIYQLEQGIVTAETVNEKLKNLK